MRFTLDIDLFHKWRKLAVTRREDMEIGQSFWCTNDRHFTLMGFTSEAAFIALQGLKPEGDTSCNIAVSTIGHLHRLREMNVDSIGISPWLLFRDPATCRACQISMPVTIDTGR